MKKNTSSSDIFLLRVLFVLGILGIVFVLGALSFFSVRMLRRQHALLDQSPILAGSSTEHRGNGFLGEKGSACGGVKRLPCKPGLMCDAATDGVSEGTCVKDPKAPVGDVPMQFGEACGVDLPACAPGLFCREDAQRNRLMFCSKLNEEAPFIVSVKVDGMSPADGGYHGAVGSKVTLHIQTTSVDRVELRLKGKSLGEAKKLSGGTYDFEWTVPAGLDGEIRVLAFRKAEFSSVGLHVVAE